jgi:hypothetical protein
MTYYEQHQRQETGRQKLDEALRDLRVANYTTEQRVAIAARFFH